MRLLTADKLQFEEFIGIDVPKYAILSHRWEREELTYQDMCAIMENANSSSDLTNLSQKRGYRKIYAFSRQALIDGYSYIWVDTCCIDKSSSTELQEAINSMYQWYRESGVCYAYLSDVSTVDHCDTTAKLSEGPPAWVKPFQRSKWFTRGWTLQELLAPREVVFFDKEWRRCGTGSELRKVIHEAIDLDIEAAAEDLGPEGSRYWSIRVGRRLYWAANRQTTRVEDRAYSLLGIMDVNMPLLYGEGERAFQRLQEEIIRVDEDISLLAWSSTDTDMGFAPNGLARSPTHFRKYSDLVKRKNNDARFVAFDPKMTARGLCVSLKLQRDPLERKLAYAVLMYEKDRESLVLPVFFTDLTFARSEMENECVRFSDPVWVPSHFIENASSEPLCFIRPVHAAFSYHSCDGFSLTSTVWRDYVTTFTYPMQTQPGRRHFPAVLGGFSSNVSHDQRWYSFIIELTSRSCDSRKFVVKLRYQVRDKSIYLDQFQAVTIMRLGEALSLADAIAMVESGSLFSSCVLPDRDGKPISRGDIVSTRRFNSYWIPANEDTLDSILLHPATEPLTRDVAYLPPERLSFGGDPGTTQGHEDTTYSSVNAVAMFKLERERHY